MRRTMSLQILLLLLVILSLGLAAGCGGGGGGGGGAAPAATATPEEKATAEEEPTRITDVPPPATHVFEQPTTIIETKATPGATTATPASADAKLIERGKGIYEKKGCGECHGASGEGVSDKGPKLAGTSLTETELDDVLRTGGKVGNEHIYGINAISRSGIKAVYAFLQSLAP